MSLTLETFCGIKYKNPEGYTISVDKTQQNLGNLDEFRSEFFKAHCLDYESLKNCSYSDWRLHFQDTQEDCFRLLPYRTNLNSLVCLVSNQEGKFVHGSFCNIDKGYMRIGIGFNTLPSYRTKLLVPMWRKDWGYLDTLLKFDVKGHFVTFHGRNSKLQAMIKMIKKNRSMSGFLGQAPSYLSEFKAYANEQPYPTKNTLQLIAYRDSSGKTTLSNYDSFLKELL